MTGTGPAGTRRSVSLLLLLLFFFLLFIITIKITTIIFFIMTNYMIHLGVGIVQPARVTSMTRNNLGDREADGSLSAQCDGAEFEHQDRLAGEQEAMVSMDGSQVAA